MREYAVAAALGVVAAVVYELRVARTGLFRRPAYWITMGICLFFMVLVNGWLTKLSAPIVRYASEHKTPWRFPLDIPVEDYLFGFALLTLVLIRWLQLAPEAAGATGPDDGGRTAAGRSRAADAPDGAEGGPGTAPPRPGAGPG